jgi:hypothetical protein
VTLSDWKEMAITQEFLAELQRRLNAEKESLTESAGVDPRLDSYRAGVIAALKDVVDFHFDEENSVID